MCISFMTRAPTSAQTIHLYKRTRCSSVLLSVTLRYVMLRYSIISCNDSCSLTFPNQIYPAGPGIRPSLPNSKYSMSTKFTPQII